MDRLDAMRLFVRVVEQGSFSAVAQQMGVARSVVTRQIAALESHLHTKLLARSTRSLALTSAGTAYLEKCRVILNLVEAAESDIAGELARPRGNIRISLPLVYGINRLAPLLMAFARLYPEVGLDMDYSDRRVNLIEEGFDLSVRITRKLSQNEVARRIGQASMRVVAATAYLERHGRPSQPEDLANHECLGYTIAGSADSWPFIIGGQTVQVAVSSRINGNNGDVLMQAAVQGFGITCQPDFIADSYLSSGQVEQILLDYPVPELGIHAMLPGNRHIPHRVRVLIDYLQDELARPVS